jgi:phytoene dehydrogenase-like protein
MTRIVIVGGGHNGLVCGCYLARAGADVTIVERSAVVGGAAITEEFAPGFRNSVASYTVSLLHPEVIRDLNLVQHGLAIRKRLINNYLPMPDGDAFIACPGDGLIAEISRFSPRDAAHYPSYQAELATLVEPLRSLMDRTPPSFHLGGLGDVIKVISMSRRFAGMRAATKQKLLKLFTVSAGEWLDDEFESDAVKAWLGFDAVVGHYQSPYGPGSAYVMVHHALGGIDGEAGIWGHAMGGMGAITQAMASEAESLGVSIATGVGVSRIDVDKHGAKGVTLSGGETIEADAVVSAINPRLLFLKLIEPRHCPADIRRHFEQFKCASGSFRMNVALTELPDFQHRRIPHCLEGGIIMAPSLEYMDAAYEGARRRGFSERPIVEMLIPSLVDDSLAPPGAHVASLFCQQFDPGLGAGWDGLRDSAVEAIINTVSAHAPNFRASITGMQVLSPWDLEQRFGLVGGDIFHGRMSLDQLFSARPMLGMGQYRTHIKGLYLCSAGTHPGGGVSGIPGRNAATEIRRDLHLG